MILSDSVPILADQLCCEPPTTFWIKEFKTGEADI